MTVTGTHWAWQPARQPGLPTLLLLHGTGGTEHDLLPLAAEVLPGAACLAPRGAVLEQGMPRFFRRLTEGVFDQEDLRLRTGELADFIRAAAEREGFDPTQVIAIGFSNGANIAASLLLRAAYPLHGAVLLRPMLPFEPDTLPALGGTRVLIESGSQDGMVTRAQVEALASTLSSAGASVDVVWQPAGHGLTRADVETAKRWLSAR